jgi:hypothetical protein
MDVVVRNMSESGVKLKLTTPEPLPDHFTLYIELDGILVDCEVVWRNGDEIGARFTSEIIHKGPKRVQRLQPSQFSPKPTIRKKIY